MFGMFPLVGAYGRKYLSEEELLKDWESEKDFLGTSGQYCSIRDFPDYSEFRYGMKLEHTLTWRKK